MDFILFSHAWAPHIIYSLVHVTFWFLIMTCVAGQIGCLLFIVSEDYDIDSVTGLELDELLP